MNAQTKKFFDKIFLNSFYHPYSPGYFQFFDVGEAKKITEAGRKILKENAK